MTQGNETKAKYSQHPKIFLDFFPAFSVRPSIFEHLKQAKKKMVNDQIFFSFFFWVIP
jgi:hypothetical protein